MPAGPSTPEAPIAVDRPAATIGGDADSAALSAADGTAGGTADGDDDDDGLSGGAIAGIAVAGVVAAAVVLALCAFFALRGRDSKSRTPTESAAGSDVDAKLAVVAKDGSGVRCFRRVCARDSGVVLPSARFVACARTLVSTCAGHAASVPAARSAAGVWLLAPGAERQLCVGAGEERQRRLHDDIRQRAQQRLRHARRHVASWRALWHRVAVGAQVPGCRGCTGRAAQP